MNWSYSIGRVTEAAQQLISEANSRDLRQLYKTRELYLYECPDFDELKGMYAQVDGRRCVFIKSDLPQDLRELVLAHELGHDVLHRELLEQSQIMKEVSYFDLASTPEMEANLFAATILLEDDSFLEMAEAGYSLDQMAAALGQCVELLSLKALILEKQGHKLRLPERYAADFLLRA